LSTFSEEYYKNYPTTLKEWQASSLVHPYTCGNRDDPVHVMRRGDKDFGVLIVAEDNTLYCRDCDYIQDTPDFYKKKIEDEKN